MHSHHLLHHLNGKSRANAAAALMILQLRARDNAEAAAVLEKVQQRATGVPPLPTQQDRRA